MLIERCVERNVAENAVFETRLRALERQRLVVDGKLVDEQLLPCQQIGQVTDAKHTDAALPDPGTDRVRIGKASDLGCQENMRNHCYT